MKFEKGREKTGGRVKGTPNKSKELADKILTYALKQNVTKDLDELRTKYPTKYWDVIGRLLPKAVEVSGSDDGSPVQFIIRGFNDKGNSDITS